MAYYTTINIFMFLIISFQAAQNVQEIPLICPKRKEQHCNA
uniref:Uncharacterized protein n=1 Tax=Arundo donax TaxID=35708 RepID=A0A0A8ZRG9_ARUDO